MPTICKQVLVHTGEFKKVCSAVTQTTTQLSDEATFLAFSYFMAGIFWLAAALILFLGTMAVISGAFDRQEKGQ